MEKWKKIDGFDKYYVSNRGRVKNKKTGRVLKPCVSSWGYLRHTLSLNGVTSVVRVHRLMALAFIPNPENKPTVNHIDGNKTNNSLDNLEWATYSENNFHAYRIGLKVAHWLGKFKADHPRSKTVTQLKDGHVIGKYISLTEAAEKANVSIGNISKVISGERKHTKGFTWELT